MLPNRTGPEMPPIAVAMELKRAMAIAADEEAEMSVFPAKILVATDGSEDAVLAVQAAVDLSNETGAELHLVHVGESL
ncbi:MAG TPA: universal stress protein, partial [Rubrobacter sp.]|nr:universal stress protein [Rubrobacter sp.]